MFSKDFHAHVFKNYENTDFVLKFYDDRSSNSISMRLLNYPGKIVIVLYIRSVDLGLCFLSILWRILSLKHEINSLVNILSISQEV